MDQAEFLNTYINKLTTELTETLKRKVLVETENEVQKKTIESQTNTILDLTKQIEEMSTKEAKQKDKKST